MTKPVQIYATLPASDSKPAALVLGCRRTRVIPELRFPVRIGFGQIQASYRFDGGKIIPREVRLSDNGERAFLWENQGATATSVILRSKRLQVQIGNVVFEFNLAGADNAVRVLQCV